MFHNILNRTKDDSVKTEWINYLGIGLILVSLVLFFNITPNANNDKNKNSPSTMFNPISNNDSLIDEHRLEMLHDKNELLFSQLEQNDADSILNKLTSRQREILGICMALFAGVCYGTCFCPIQYVMKHHKHDDKFSQQLQDYAFTHYCGILLTSMAYFMVYVLYMKNKPQVNNEAILPSIMSGFVWAIAQTCFFIATDKNNLGTDTAFPIVSGSPQVVASLWGVVVFREITNMKDLILLACAVIVCVSGVVGIGLSKLSL